MHLNYLNKCGEERLFRKDWIWKNKPICIVFDDQSIRDTFTIWDSLCKSYKCDLFYIN